MDGTAFSRQSVKYVILSDLNPSPESHTHTDTHSDETPQGHGPARSSPFQSKGRSVVAELNLI